MKFNSTLTALSLVAFAAPALAGNPVPPRVDPAPVPPPVLLSDWSGFYVGLTAMKADGTFGNNATGQAAAFPPDGEGDLDGAGYGILLGWNGQSGKMVYGAELSYQKTDITGSEEPATAGYLYSAEVEDIAALRARLGWLAGQNTLIYGTAGIASAKMTASIEEFGDTPFSDEQTLNGYVYGLGLEQKVTDRISLRGAVMRYDFDGEDYELNGTTYEDVGTEFTAFELGVSYNF